jgi:hypothetical protein
MVPKIRSPKATRLVTLLAIPMILFFLSCELGTVDPTIHAQALCNGLLHHPPITLWFQVNKPLAQCPSQVFNLTTKSEPGKKCSAVKKLMTMENVQNLIGTHRKLQTQKGYHSTGCHYNTLT